MYGESPHSRYLVSRGYEWSYRDNVDLSIYRPALLRRDVYHTLSVEDLDPHRLHARWRGLRSACLHFSVQDYYMCESLISVLGNKFPMLTSNSTHHELLLAALQGRDRSGRICRWCQVCMHRYTRHHSAQACRCYGKACSGTGSGLQGEPQAPSSGVASSVLHMGPPSPAHRLASAEHIMT